MAIDEVIIDEVIIRPKIKVVEIIDDPTGEQMPFPSAIPEGGAGVAIYWGGPVHGDPLGQYQSQYLRWDAPCFRGIDWRDTRRVSVVAYALVASMHPIPSNAQLYAEIKL